MKFVSISLFVLLILLSCQSTYSLIEWDFELLRWAELLALKFQLGTPFQNGGLFVVNDPNTPALAVPSVLNEYGFYNPNQSSTFVQTGLSKDEYGFVNGRAGIETFQIGASKTVVTKKPLEVVDQEWRYSNYGLLGLARPKNNKDGQSFVQAVVAEGEEPVVVVLYDEISDKTIKGSLSLGGRPTSKCDNKNWMYVQEANFTDNPQIQWAFKLDSLTIGKYSFRQPGQALVSIEMRRLGVPENVRSSLLDALSGDQQGNIPCDSQKVIEFAAGDLTLNWYPKDYVGEEQSNGLCDFNISDNLFDGPEGFILPVSILRDYCYLLDYSKNQIGFAPRV